jgi:Trk K+ transport system NAD-binding subunit
MTHFRETYGLDYELFEVQVPSDSPLVGMTLDDVEHENKVRVIASAGGGKMKVGPGTIARDTGIAGATCSASSPHRRT